MRTIHKFPLEIIGTQTISVPLARYIPLFVAMQNGTLCLWADVVTDGPMIKQEITIIGTGHKWPDYGTYLGSVQQDQFVWHVFT